MIRIIVCPHVRWVGRPWVVISKTLGQPVNGLSTASLPAWFPRLPGGASSKYGTSKSNLYFIQIVVVDGESVRRSTSAPHQFAANAQKQIALRRICQMNQDLKEQAHGEIERIFRILLPQNGLTVREEQISLCHAMLDTLLQNRIALCDAGVGIGRTYAYLTACILLKQFYHSGPAGSQPVVVSTSSVALQDAIIGKYIPFLSRIFLENRIISKPIRAMVRKGKERFVCDARLSQWLAAVQNKKKNAEQRQKDVCPDPANAKPFK